MDGGITNTRPRLNLDGNSPTFSNVSVGDVAEDSDLALSVDRATDGAVVRKGDVDGVSGHFG